MINYYLQVMQDNYSNFSGRARRSEYWYFLLCYYIIAFIAIILDASLGLSMEIGGIPLAYGWITIAVALAHFLPSIALVVRRLYDVGKSGWFYFIAFIPFIGAIWLIVLFCTEGDQEENKYGANPKA
jgi:uncharacterized membrane protein YhaH (DUF805 family)